MANEGSTKRTYSELEAENLRVRGLLQRYGTHDDFCSLHFGEECNCGLAEAGVDTGGPTHQHFFSITDSVGLYRCPCGQYAVPQLVTVGNPPEFQELDALLAKHGTVSARPDQSHSKPELLQRQSDFAKVLRRIHHGHQVEIGGKLYVTAHTLIDYAEHYEREAYDPNEICSDCKKRRGDHARGKCVGSKGKYFAPLSACTGENK